MMQDWCPTILRRTATAISALLLLSAVGGIILTVVNTPKPAWFALSFEVAILGATAVGLAAGLRRTGRCTAMAYACVAGVVMAGSFLSGLSAHWTLGSLDLRLIVIARIAAAGVLALIAAWAILGRAPTRTVPMLARAGAAGVVASGLLVGVWLLRAQFAGMSEVVRFVLGVVVFLILTGLVAAAVDRLIRAFEIGVESPPPGAPPATR
ncbi:MAG: hypothetical protein KF745_01930 [Phycisphaeraceae bacterium]|nr:hypothetical protein [Phycisphaeraceae bacterium]